MKAQQAANILIKHSWQIQLMATGGANPSHSSMHRLHDFLQVHTSCPTTLSNTASL